MDRFRMFPWTKALWFNIQAERQGSPRQAIMYRQYPFSEQKQQKAKVKVKETDLTYSQIWLFSVTVSYENGTQNLWWLMMDGIYFGEVNF